ncbi:nebulin isoform X19 [Pelobates fuscus]|uniref:nebulin isoform X19 n=1 Tax=Pelobates fuscus TaxID=191477 RepID=UPI002FE490C8
MADDEEIEEYEYFYEETIIEDGDTVEDEPKVEEPVGPSEQPTKRRIRKKVDTSKFMTPYIAHSKKMQDMFSQNKYKEKYEKHRGEPYASTTDTPELRRIKKVQNQLSEVKYRMDGNVARTNCHVDEKARDIEHAKKVSQQVSKVLYKQNWEDTKDKYLLPPDAPELVQAVKNTSMFSKKLYTADWDEDKSTFFPYSDSPELKRVAHAQKALSDINYKKGYNERQLQFTSLADRPDIEMAKKVSQQLSDIKYREDYQKKVKGKWSQTPCYEIAVARMNADNLSDRKYTEDFENAKDQINFMQTDTPEYKANKKARLNASTVQYKADYEKAKGPTAYHTLPATENPLLRQLKLAGRSLSDILYKESYEKAKGTSINYCDTPKFQIDHVLKDYSDLKYKDHYNRNILGHYIGTYEDPYLTHCAKVANFKSDKNYRADYEEDKTSCYFPQTLTQEYDAVKKLDQCKDYVYKKHPDKIKYTQVADSPGMLQAQVNSKQLSDLNYKSKHEKEKFKCHIPADSPFILQSRLNAYNLSDKWYKYDWEKQKAKKFDIKIDAIPLVAAKANRRKASDVAYKKDYELNKGKMIGALSIHDDPKMLHSVKVAHNQSDIEYKKDYEKLKTKYSTPLDMVAVTSAKKAQAIASNIDYKHPLHSYFYPPDSVSVSLAKKAYTIQSDIDYKSDYNSWVKGCGWSPYGSLDEEKVKKAGQILNERKYRQHPDTIKFTSVEDDPVMVQSKINQKQRSDILYKAADAKRIHTYSLPADIPEFIQARVNAYNLSDNYYKQGLEELKAKGYDLKSDAISIRAAKAARKAASDVQYKKAYEDQKGKLVGFRSLQDDPKLVHYMRVAKIQSEREYKKDYEKTKTKYNTPLDMVNVVSAKKAQDIASGIHYKQPIHHYTYLPDAMSVELSKKMMEIQSDNLYKSDLGWLKGTGWIPLGSLDVEKVKKAGAALDEKKYRQHPDTIKFTSVADTPVMVQAKTNALQLSDRLYKSSGEKTLHTYHLPPDVPQFIQARCNAANISETNYKQDWLKTIKKGHHVLGDAISIVAAKASHNIASDYKYKQAYEKARGKHVGFRSLQDDPKLVHFMAVAKMQSEREYKKDYEQTKTKYHTPLDMVSISAAKKSQEAATNINYKHPIHHYTFLPDAISVERSRNMMQIQSDNVYKQDYNSWLKGIGWMPLGSLEVEKVKKAGNALSEKKYRQHPDTLKFTSIPDSIEMALAQHNTKQRSDITYKADGEKVKHKYNLNPDDPNFIQARVNAYNISESSYKADWIKHLAKGYDLKPDAISVVAAKASRNIASDYKYKQAYEKDKGKQVGFRSLQDDPKLVHYMHVAKIQSDREYKKDYEKTKLKYHTPVNMFSITAAKKAQEVSTNINYKQLIHNYTLLPDAVSLERAKNMMQIQSDNLYKTDFNNWLKGVGWVPIGSLDVEKAKKAKDILSEKKYRQNPDQWKFSIPNDAMDQVLAKHNAQTMNKRLYINAWEKDKTKIHVMPDTPEIVLSKANQINMSDKLYRSGYEADKKKGYDLKPDAISIKAARASRDIASDYKYKQAYEKTRGKHIGFRSLQDDPKLVHFMQVAKMQSEREYKKGYEKSKTKFHTPVDMFSVTAAKLAQNVATNTNYKQLIHHYNLLPDAMPLQLSRNRMQIQSDNVYKSDYNDFVKGVGWIPYGSQEAEKNRKSMDILSEKKYRQQPDTFRFTSVPDSMPMVLAKSNAQIMDHNLYTQAWNKDKTTIHVMPDSPEFLLAKANAVNISEKKYRQALEDSKKKGYDLRGDAISIKAAKASRDIASDYKYKKSYEMDKGKMVGFRNLQDDPKLVHFMNVAKMQSDREYHKEYEKTKTKYHTPVTTFSVMAAKDAQEKASNVNYKRLLHKYILLPDAMPIQLAKNMNQIQSDNEYKVDYKTWYKGMGWSPLGSLDVEKSRKATDIASDNKYRQHPSQFKFTKSTDSMDLELAKQNAQVMNRRSYIDAWEKDKKTVHVMPDTPEILLAKQNKTTYSQKQYRQGWEEAIKQGYDLRPDAISIKAAKASRDIASDYKYKTAYRKQQGHHVGFRSLQDDPKSVWAMHVAKIQSDREYKKDYDKWRTKFNTPVDMLGILLAKKCQTLVSDIDYKRRLHNWTCLPDQTAFVQARKVYDIQSDINYKADYNEFMKGVGWIPYGSQEAEKNRKAMDILSNKKYRQHPDKIKFTSIPDSMELVLAKNNAEIMNKKRYIQAWEKDKREIHIMPDTPDILLAKANLLNTSDKLYKAGYEEIKKKGYDLKVDAISIKAAKASRDIASDYKYKAAYRKQQGHHVGFRSLQDDPKSVWAMHIAKIQSEREYKKDYEKWRHHFNTPVDMLGILLAKKCQTLVSDIDYKHFLHKWTCLPDQNDVVQARKTYDIQSDNLYKSDLQWLKGVGWSPSGSLEEEKNKRASLILSDTKYRQHPDKFRFKSIPDSLEMVLAKSNADIMNKRLYTDAWNKDKTQIHLMPDIPEVLLAKQNKINFSDKLYKQAMEDDKKKGYDLRADAISIKAARASRDIASDYKYKTGYRKQQGHHVGFKSLQDDPKSVWAIHVAKIQSDRVYKKEFEKLKTKYNSPVEMLSVLLAKNCQKLVSDIDYRHYLHQWTCLPDQNDVIQARKAYNLQSDWLYKSDMEWIRGCGWIPNDSLEVNKVKKAQDILSERKYRQNPDTIKFTSIVDPPHIVLAKANALQLSDHVYRDAWDKDKTQFSLPSDTPQMLQSKINAANISEKVYKQDYETSKKKGYDLRADAIPIRSARASRDIASDYKYKKAHEQQKGHYIGAPTAKDDPKLMWLINAGKLPSDLRYKKDFEKTKTKIQIPADMVSILTAKQVQAAASEIDYRTHLHQWTCHPDQNDCIQAKKAYELQSDNIYKSDLEWIRGCGWIPNESVEVKKVKHAQDILNDHLYRQPASSLKFTSIVDLPSIVLAKTNADQLSAAKYKEAWEQDKRTIHVMPDTPEIMLSRANAVNVSNKLYRDSWDKVKMIYDLRSDAIPIKAAKASREIASDYKYKLSHEKQKGHYIGTTSAQGDNKMAWFLKAYKLHSDLLYKKDFEKTKTNVNLPVDMVSIVSAKLCQTLVSDIDYRHYLHKWTCLPDQNDVIQARKAYDLQSDALYKSDLEWLRGVGWMPNESFDVKKVKFAQDILSESKYRTKPETLNFTPVTDRVDYVSAKQGAEILSDIKYHEAWNGIKTKYTALSDTPLLITAREAAKNVNNKLYKEGWEKVKATGYLLPHDAVQIKHARKSDTVQSELKYKADYIKQRGHYVGVSNADQDPKLRWFKHANFIQNDREYKKLYEKLKSKITIPVDMVSIEAAKQGQTLASDVDYRHYLHQWTCHPDQNDCIQARKAYDLQSDNLYKSDLEWIRGCGWIPLDSVEHQKVRKAQELVNERAYKKDALDSFSNFTPIVDPPSVVLAKLNAVNQSDLKYKETFNAERGLYIGSAETPQLTHSREMSKLASEKLYKDSWDTMKALGYQIPPDYIPIVGAKHAGLVSSELKYKENHEKEKGHYLAGGHIDDFPSVGRSLAFQKMRSLLRYKKAYEDNKAKINIPGDMLNNVLAKKCQQILSDIEYRHYLHEWTCLPDERNVIHARKANEILSDNVYKEDLTWLKGIGCYVWDTPEIVRAKKSYDLQSQALYTNAGKENLKNYSLVTDTPVYVTAVQSTINASDVKYKEDFHKTKDKYTTVLETVDFNRTQNLKDLFSHNLYKQAWDSIKATSYQLPADTVALAFAKKNKHMASHLKYREEYEKFKALYTLPRGIQDDPNTARCLRVGKLPLDRLYRDVYEKNKSKIHIAPDMLEIIAARETQDKVSEIDYRKRLHEWICLPDLQTYVHARKVNDQLSDIVYKDDLNWLKGLGCFVWDTPEILHAKHAYNLRNDFIYKAKAEEMKKTYSSVMETPVYVQAKASGKQSSDVIYHSDYEHNVKGKVTSSTTSIDLDRARNANKIQSVNLYREDGVNYLPKGYSLPNDTPLIKLAKNAQAIGSDLKYKELYEHAKAKSYTLGPDNVNFENIRKVNKVLNERLYRQLYHKQKDKIHTTPDTPEIRQVKATQEAISDLVYKSDYHKLQGHLISMPFTPQTIHCRYVGEITSDNKYKEDLQWLKGLGCFLYDTPDMVRARDLRKLWSHYLYTTPAKKMLDKYSVVLDTPEYRTVQELKTHLSQFVYRAEGNKQKSIYTSVLNTPDFVRAKKGQEIQSQYLYGEVASKLRPIHHADGQTQSLKLAKHVKELVSEKKYKAQYEKLKHKHTSIADTPIILRAKKAYLNASDLRYKETFENAKGKYHTVKDALDIVYHRKVTDDISAVKYKEKYVSELGNWRSIPDRPEYYHHRAVTDSVSDSKYKEDLTWLKGIGCYAWDTPDFTLAEQNKSLYSNYKYKEFSQKTKSIFKYTADTPLFNHFKYATQLQNEKLYKADYEKWKTHYSVVVDDPRHLLAKNASEQISQWKYKHNYEKLKDKYTSILDTPENQRAHKASKQISDNVYKMEHNKSKAKGYTSIHDTPMLLHVRKVSDKISDLKYKELYEKSRGHCTMGTDAVQIKTAKEAYKSISNLDYKKKYEKTKAQWQWTVDRPDFMQNAKASLQQSDYEYKLDREFLRGCKLSVTDDKNTVLALRNAEMNSNVKYKKRYEKGTYVGEFGVVADTPQIIHSKSMNTLVSENKYKEEGKKMLPHGAYTKLPDTRDTTHVKEVTKLVSDTQYKEKFKKDKGKSNYANMQEPPEVKHAMDVAKVQSNVAYRKEAKAHLNYTSIADRPDIQKATQVAKLVSNIQYKAKARAEQGRGISIVGRPDIELAQEVSKLTSQAEYTKGKMWGHGAASYDTPIMRTLKKANELTSNVKYKENFSKDKRKRPQYDLKEAQIYQTFKDANTLASEVKYKADLKKLHKPVTDMAESLNMQHITSTSKLSSDYRYKKEYEKNKGHYQLITDNLEQVHVKEATDLQSQVKYKEKYEKERGKAMMDFETPTYVTAMESQHMQSEKEYKKDFEECCKGRNLTGLEVTPSMLHVRHATKIASEKEYRKDLDDTKGRGITILEETPEFLRAKNATQILNEKEYKKTLELEIKGRGLSTLVMETPDFMRAKNATDIASQVKYKHSAEMEKANYTSVVDTPEIIHAQQVKNLSSKKKYKEEAERNMSYYVPVYDTPEMQRVRENQKNFSTLQYQGDHMQSKGKVTVVKDTPEILRVKENQKNFSSILYKEEIGKGTAIGHTPEMERIKRTQDAISTIKYKEIIGQGTPISDLPEVKRVKETQKNISSVMYKENTGQGTSTPVTPEMERVKRNQENISMVMYKENMGMATPIPVTPEMERVKRNQENISSVSYKEHMGHGTPTPVTPEMERAKRNQENISMVLYKENLGKATPAPVTPEMERVKRNQENISSVLYSDSFRKQIQGRAAFVLDTPEMRRVRESQRHISSVKYHEDFEKQKGSFTPVVTDPITERVKKNMIDFSDINYRGIQRKVVEMERKRSEQDQDVTDLRVWRTNPGSVFDYDPAEDNIQSRSLHMLSVQARRSREHSRSASALSLSAGDEKSESEVADHHHSYYSNGGIFTTTTVTGHKESAQVLFYQAGYKQAKTTELPQQRSSSVATQQTTASSVPSHPSTTGKTFRAMYDYRAADNDEVSFRDGDNIVNVQTIDEGWMYGTVQRTGKTGMLPANYVEAI